MNNLNRINSDELRILRNDIKLNKLMEAMNIHTKFTEGYWRFVCPKCSEMNTSVNPKNNLGRCFRCCINYNTIDIVMSYKGYDFRQTIGLLREIHKAIKHAKMETSN